MTTHAELVDDGRAIRLALRRDTRRVYSRPRMQIQTRLPVQKSCEIRMRRVGNRDEGRREGSKDNSVRPSQAHRGWVRGAIGRPHETTKGVFL